MSACRLRDRVRTTGGEVTTLAELLDSGRAVVERVERFYARNGAGHRTAYFVTMPDGGCWEIGRLAYLSRTGQTVSL